MQNSQSISSTIKPNIKTFLKYNLFFSDRCTLVDCWASVPDELCCWTTAQKCALKNITHITFNLIKFSQLLKTVNSVWPNSNWNLCILEWKFEILNENLKFWAAGRAGAASAQRHMEIFMLYMYHIYIWQMPYVHMAFIHIYLCINVYWYFGRIR